MTRLVDHRARSSRRCARPGSGASSSTSGTAGSFSWEVARLLAEQGFWPDTISTDVHTSSIKEPIAIDMPSTMTRLLHLGMGLAEVIAPAPGGPGRAIGWEDRIGALRPGMAGDVAVLALEEGEFRFTELPTASPWWRGAGWWPGTPSAPARLG